MNDSVSPFIKQLTSAHKKSVLLIDVDSTTRELRAKSLRSRGVIVDCEGSAVSGWSRYESGSYHLVLLNLGGDKTGEQTLADNMRSLREKQKVAFFVEGPSYISFMQSGGSSRPKPKRAPAPIVAPMPAVIEGSDFGQRVKRAEAERERQSRPSF